MESIVSALPIEHTEGRVDIECPTEGEKKPFLFLFLFFVCVCVCDLSVCKNGVAFR